MTAVIALQKPVTPSAEVSAVIGPGPHTRGRGDGLALERVHRRRDSAVMAERLGEDQGA